MKYEDFNIGEIYGRVHDDIVYKCVDATNDWVLMIYYESSHYVAGAEFWNRESLDEEWLKELREIHGDLEVLYKDVFANQLEPYRENQTLRHKLAN